jgi:hypothetical protein
MCSHATTCSVDKAGCAARLPFRLPQNGAGFMVTHLYSNIEPTTDTPFVSVWQRGAQSLHCKEDAKAGRFVLMSESPVATRHMGSRRNQSPRPDQEDLRDSRAFWFCKILFVLRRLDSSRSFDWPIQQRSATGRFLALKKTSRGVR